MDPYDKESRRQTKTIDQEGMSKWDSVQSSMMHGGEMVMCTQAYLVWSMAPDGITSVVATVGDDGGWVVILLFGARYRRLLIGHE
jgi:hypothetical protein